MYSIIAVIIVVIVVAAAGVSLYGGNNNNSTSSTPTPTATPTATAAPENVTGASTLQFNVNDTSSSGTSTYQFTGANLGTSNMTVRLDLTRGASTYTFILNAGSRQSWESVNGAAYTSGNFTSDWINYGGLWSTYYNELSTNWNGSGTTHAYTASSGDSILIFNINCNPTLPASTFQTS